MGVSATTAVLSLVLGMFAYILVPISVATAHVELRHRVGKAYLHLAVTSLQQFVILRRVMSGYDILPIKVNDEQKRMRVTLDSNTLSDDAEFPFKDPDNRIQRLWNKPVALAYEEVPAAVDAELAEQAHWTHQKKLDEGLYHDDDSEPGTGLVDPFVPTGTGLRLIDPIDVYYLVTNGVRPEAIRTAEQKTRKRFEKYGPALSMEETLSGVIGFLAGIGAVWAINYLQTQVAGGGGGGGDSTTIGLPVIVPPDGLATLVVMLA